MRVASLLCGLAMVLTLAVAGSATAQDVVSTPTDGSSITLSAEQALAQAEEAKLYWTRERMASAKPMPIPTILVDPSAPMATRAEAPSGPPKATNGWKPGSGPYIPKVQTFSPSEARAMGSTPQSYGTAPTNPKDGPYGPFQRWTMEGRYLQWARDVHGKLFFVIPGSGTYVCSGTVIGRSTIVTAGHCVADGAGSFYTNWWFCPSYYQDAGGSGAPNPSRGCWSWTQAKTSDNWLYSGDPDYDYACIVTATTGDTISDKIGNVTGWAGVASNWVNVPEMIFGYPHAAPFDGSQIEQVATVDWYDWDPIPGGQVSKIVGNDLTGGSSGGGWFLSWRAPDKEYPDTDGSTDTDPAGAQNYPLINGVNSHKRCVTSCQSPPTTTNGVFWQEMTSPPFMDTAASDESTDVFAVCLAHANNN